MQKQQKITFLRDFILVILLLTLSFGVTGCKTINKLRGKKELTGITTTTTTVTVVTQQSDPNDNLR